MATRRKFRTQHVAQTPRGWKVRSKREGGHVLRIAFPPGRRKTGSGQLVEILHPASENPCHIKNPAELVIFGNPLRRRKRNSSGGAPGHKPGCPCAICKNMRANPAARDKGLSPTRKAARRRVAVRRQLRSMGVPLDSRGEESLNQLRAKRRKALGNAGDDVTETKEAVELYRTFQGKDPQAIVTRQRSAAMRTDYTALGPLLAVGIYAAGESIPSPDHWDSYPHLKFERDVMLASNSGGTQLYAIGGNQDCSGFLDELPGADGSKDLVELGEVAFVVYFARKAPTFKATEYMHKFDAPRPVLGYDQLKQEIFFVGGGYTIEAPGIVH